LRKLLQFFWVRQPLGANHAKIKYRLADSAKMFPGGNVDWRAALPLRGKMLAVGAFPAL
jgi:hypothetical protein